MKRQHHKTFSQKETEKLGEEFSKLLKPGDTIFLYGELGAGKTHFIKGIAIGIGVEKRIISPTFVLVRSYKSSNGNAFYHSDLYRLDSSRQAQGAGILDLTQDKSGITAIEWAEKLSYSILPSWEIWFEHVSENERSIVIQKSNYVDLKKAKEMLKIGKIGIFPTDTAFAIGCAIEFEDQVKKIYDIRKRPESKPLLALVNGVDMAKQYVEISKEVEDLIKKYWPGPLTLILPCKKDMVPKSVRANGDSLAVRLPNNEYVRDLINGVVSPVLAPSANFSGEPTPFSIKDIDDKLLDEVDFVLPGVSSAQNVSTIIDCTSFPFKEVRSGVLKINL